MAWSLLEGSTKESHIRERLRWLRSSNAGTSDISLNTLILLKHRRYKATSRDRSAAGIHGPNRFAAAIVTRRMSRLYDLMLMLDPAAPEDRRLAILSNVQTAIEDGGVLVAVHDWGERD